MDRAVELVLDKLQQAVVDLQEALKHHAFYRGTYDSVLTEVQNGIMLKAEGGGTPIEHLDSLKKGLRGVENANAAYLKAADQLNRLDHKAIGELSDALQPLLRLARAKMELAGDTVKLAERIGKRHPNRLAGQPLQTKGRTVGALTSTQLANRGVKALPDELAADPKVKGLLADIAKQPLDAKALGDQVAEANKLVRAALERKLGHATTSEGTRRFSRNLAARFGITGHLVTPAGLNGATTAAAALKREAMADKATSQLDEAVVAVEKMLAKEVPGSVAHKAARARLIKTFGRRLIKVAESRVAKRMLSMVPVAGWGFSAVDAWNGGKDVVRGNVGRGLSGIGLAVADVASDFLHLGDAVSGVGGTALSLAAQGGSIAAQVKIEMDRVKDNMARVLAEVDRTGQLPPDARLKDEFELDDDTITELKAAMAG